MQHSAVSETDRFAEGVQASYVCSSKRNAKMISMERWWNDADRGEPK